MLRSFCLIAAIAVTQAIPTTVALAETARGTVFNDMNGNGSRDSHEPGISGMQVSNGLEVVTTDKQGRYELPVDDDEIIFVIKPRDWATPLDELNMPRQFYYIHKPKGSPDEDFIFKGVEPTGPLPEAINFPLRKSPEQDKFKVLLIGDPQPYSQEHLDWYARDIIAEVAGIDCAFAIALGDLVGDDLSLFDPLNEVQSTIGIPIYNVYGNHDMNFMSPDEEHADETFERVYGPPNYAFQYADVHFILLDNVLWKGFYGKEPSGFPKNGNYEGNFSDKQLKFVENYVKTVPEEERIVVCTHIPLPNWEGRQHSTPQFPRLLEILSKHPYTMSFSGHTHINRHFFSGSEDGYTPKAGTDHHHHNVGTASGSWYRGPLDETGIPCTTMRDGSPNGYVLATFDGTGYKLRFKAARMPAGHQMNIIAPEVVDADESAEILVNVFNGSDKSTTRMRIATSDWITMDQCERNCPCYEVLYKRDVANRTEGRKTLPGPVKTPHLWTANLPSGLPEGVHVLEVETTDMFGQQDTGKTLLRVE